MSLINDALRRKGETRKNPGSEPASGAPMQPVHGPRNSDSASFGPILFLLIALVIVLAGWFLFKGVRSPSQPAVTTTVPFNSSNTEAVVTQSETETPPVTVEAIPVPPQAAVAVAATTEPTNTPASIPAESNTTVVAETVPPPPPLKLQGIFFRVKNPSAMVNGKSVMVGESISGARVTKIEKNQVTLERDGQTLVLTLP